jgi:peptide/nickel transport system substrate-binding protein
MKRRHLMAAALSSAMLAAPRIARAARADVLKFIPQSDIGVLDPIWSSQYVTRNHALLIFETLFGTDETYAIRPQMVAGYTTENDGLLWTLTLRDGLRFHDGEPVLARDCVASLRRWGQRDGFGSTLMDKTAELSAPSDKVIRFRLRTPFPLLPDALGKNTSLMPVIMPERLAKTDAYRRVTEMVGSGPYRFMEKEQLAGAFYAYEKFDAYVPRDEPASSTAGGKTAFIPRIEWHVLPDDGTAAAALQSGEMDWWERVSPDLYPQLRRDPNLVARVVDPTGSMALLRPNHLHPPFDNPAIRRAVLGAIDQVEFMQAAAGNDHALWRDKIGIWCPLSPLANDAGMEIFAGPRNLDRSRRALEAAGYKGEKVVNLTAADHTDTNALGEVAADLMRKLGMTVEDAISDSGTQTKRRANRDGVEKGGWSTFSTTFAGADFFNPAADLAIRGNGTAGWNGWSTSPELERLRDDWFAAPDLAAQQQIARKMQVQAFQDVPYFPLGQAFRTTSFRRELTGIPLGVPIFWGVKRSS